MQQTTSIYHKVDPSAAVPHDPLHVCKDMPAWLSGQRKRQQIGLTQPYICLKEVSGLQAAKLDFTI